MRILSSLRIQTRLYIAMAFALVAIFTISAYSLNTTTKVGNLINTINAHPLIVSNTAAECRLIVSEMLKTYQEAFINSNASPKGYYEKRIEAYEKDLDTHMEKIQSLILGEEGQALARETRGKIRIWKAENGHLMDSLFDPETREIARMNLSGKALGGTEEVQLQLSSIQDYAKNKAITLAKQSEDIQTKSRLAIMAMGASLVILLFIFKLMIIRNVSTSLMTLRNAMEESIDQDKFIKVYLDGKNEIVDVGNHYNNLIGKLEVQFDLRNGLNELSNTVSGNLSMKDFTSNTLSFLADYTDSGNGVFYLYSDETDSLDLIASYALTDSQKSLKNLNLGDGIIGQAGLERKTILRKNITKSEGLITSGIISEAPLNIVAIPLVFEDRLCGVIELSSFELFDTQKMAYLDAAAEIIAVSVYSAIQREKIHQLLVDTKNANIQLEIQQQEVSKKSNELALNNEQLNILLEKTKLQAEELQVQQEELRQNNEELEEQTKALRESEGKLQLQQEELRITNEELQDNTTQLLEQKRILNEKNCALAITQNDLIKKAEALERVNNYKSEFLANMSHELRTPLNSILVLSQLLAHKERDTSLSEKEYEFAGIIHSSGQDLLTMINSVLDLSKVEAGKIEIQNEIVRLEDVLSENRNSFEPMADLKKIDLKFSIDPDMPECIITDSHRLGQIIKNLISNAIKFTHLGQVSVRFRRLREHESSTLMIEGHSYLAIEVKDTGIGIPKNKMQEVFEAFKQSDGTTSREYGGTGLGLTISLELAKLLGGHILHESEVNVGSEFSLILPSNLNEEKVQPVKLFTEEIINEHGSHDTERRILIIDDDIPFTHILSDLANKKGYGATTAHTGKDGIEKALSIAPTGIILDMGLPDMDGMTLAQILSEHERTKDIPIHIISGSEKFNTNSGLEGMPKSVIGFLKKPVDIKSIYTTLSILENVNPQEFKRILVIGTCGDEDLSEFMLLEQVEIKKVLTGKDAFKELESQIYGCIILDIQLSDISSIEFMMTLQEKMDIHTPIIIYTDEEISSDEIYDLNKYTETIILKSQKSRDRLIDEASLFLHNMKKHSSCKGITKRVVDDDKTSLSGVRVLLVDDNSRNVFALMSILELNGMHVVVAKDGMDAVRQFQENDVDLILMDIMMPKMDGYEAIRQIRDNHKGKDIPIIALTAKAMKGDRDRCIGAGASDYLIKPVEANRLLSMIKVWQS